MVGPRTRRQAKISAVSKPPQPSAIPPSLPTYEDALNNSGAWLILIEWHYKRTAKKNARLLSTEINDQLNHMHRFYVEVHKKGGWLLTTGLSEWEAIGQSLQIPKPKATYEKYMFSFEKAHDPVTSYFCRGEEERVEVNKIRPELLSPIPIAVAPKPGTIGHCFWQGLVDSDIILLRGFDRVFNLDHSYFAIERLLEEYPDFPIDVLTQVRANTFFQNKVVKERRPLKQYVNRVLFEMQDLQPPTAFVEFAVNIDIDSWRPQVDELRRKLPKRLLWGTDDDALEDVRQHIKGMTLPQIYIKTKGCWTGGHQENLRFCSVNINHGPGNCEWWAMDAGCTEAFRAEVKKNFNYDIFFKETLWWPDEDWCLAHGFKLQYIHQKPGDIVFVGVGTLHWVRSLNPTVNSSWNIGIKSFRQFEAAFDRSEINDFINLQSIVPIHNLALDLLNFDLPNLPKDLINLLQRHVNTRFTLESKVLKKALKKQKPLVDINENVVSCETCSKEIFYAYVKCWPCHVFRLRGFNELVAFHCVACAERHICSNSRLEYVAKFKSKDLKLLNSRIFNYLKRNEFSFPLEGLDYQYDKYVDENVYKSTFNGIENVIVVEVGGHVKVEEAKASANTLTINHTI